MIDDPTNSHSASGFGSDSGSNLDEGSSSGSGAARELQEALAAVAAQLADVSARVDKFVQAASRAGADSVGSAGSVGSVDSDMATGPATPAAPYYVAPAASDWAPPASVHTSSAAPGPVAPPVPSAPPAPSASVTPNYAAPALPPARPAPPPSSPLFIPPQGAIPQWGAPQSARPLDPGFPTDAAPRGAQAVPAPAVTASVATSWADTAGLKVLGWVGGGVTVLGIVMLLVVAIQQGLLSPSVRVLIGAVVGVLLLAVGGLLRRKESQTALAVTFVCTGLAVLYLTTVGAVRMADLVGPAVGHGASVVIVVIAVSIAIAWRAPWLAGVSFAASACLAPVVGGGFDVSVYVFEALMVAGGAASLLLGVGLVAWICAASAAAFMVLLGMTMYDLRPAPLFVVIVMVVLTWALFVWRWADGKAPDDPGPFAVRPRSFDPAQIARDYADFEGHNKQINAAQADRINASVSLAVAAGVLVISLAVARPGSLHDVGIGVIAAIFAGMFAALAWSSARIPSLATLSLKIVAWSASVATAAVALLRLLDGDARNIAWMVLAVIVLMAVGAERIMSLLAPALAAAGLAILVAGPALSPEALVIWPSRGLIDDAGLLSRGWSVVLPAGVLILAVCIAGWWAASRCSSARLAAVHSAIQSGTAAGLPHGYPVDDAAAADTRHTTMMGWMLVGCSAVACYGLLAITMVFAYAISPTRNGFQGGQITVTVIVTLVALVLLWQGFRRLVLRLGGLGIAAVAVAKLLLVDTQTLEALPRAMTVIGVGVLLLLAAVAYVMALSRLNSGSAPALV
ncbi:MAG: DUF2339 domain-containing protein [Nakamurella sp.]